MQSRFVARTLAATAALAMFGVSPSVSAATVVGSYGAGLNVSLTALGLVGVSIPDVAFAGSTAPPDYNLSNSVLTFTASGATGLANFGVTTGLIDDTASGSLTPLMGTGTSTVNELDAGLSLPFLPSLLNITAQTLTSTSTAKDVSGLVLTGSSKIEDLVISGALFTTPITVNASVLATTPVNDVLFNAGGLEIIANHQTSVFDGAVVDGIETTALSVIFDNFAAGTGVLSGKINIADSEAYIVDAPVAAVPEPASWAMMLLGFGVVGAVVRQRRTLALA